MAFFSRFSGRSLKPQSFVYKPRFYDPVIDDLHQRLKKGVYAEGDDALDNKEMMKQRLRKSMKRNALKNMKQKKKAIVSKNMRLLIILVILMVATYYFLGVYLPRLEAWLEGI